MSDRPVPVYGQLFRFPEGFPLKDRLVHVAHPSTAFVTGEFTGNYVMHYGMLKDFQWPAWRDADWREWIVPADTPVDCLTCLVEPLR